MGISLASISTGLLLICFTQCCSEEELGLRHWELENKGSSVTFKYLSQEQRRLLCNRPKVKANPGWQTCTQRHAVTILPREIKPNSLSLPVLDDRREVAKPRKRLSCLRREIYSVTT